MAQLISTIGTVSDFPTRDNGKMRLTDMQEAVAGYVEIVTLRTRGGLSPTLKMAVNEDGLMMGLKHNQIASRIANTSIVGNAIIFQRNEIE